MGCQGEGVAQIMIGAEGEDGVPKVDPLLFQTIHVIGTKSMKTTSAYEEPRSSGKRLHENTFDPRSIH